MQYTCHESVYIAQMIRASHRQSEGYGYDSRQVFSEIRLDTQAHSKL